MATSIKQSLNGHFEKFREKALSLLKNSIIEPSINDGDSLVVVIGPDHPWGKLDKDSKRLQTELYNEYNHLLEISKSILANTLPDIQSKFNDQSKTILEIIEQSSLTWHETIQQAISAFEKSLDEQLEALNSLNGKLDKEKILIPDTNVFISNPNLHKYRVTKRFNIIVLPSVLGELDKLKNEHRNENVRQKANTTIRNFKEYRRRGRLLEGVKITNKLTAYTIAVEPKFKQKPSWLDPNNLDDRFIASCFEIAAKYPNSDMAILTLDINMQNKADFALFPFIDPEEEGFFKMYGN